MPTGTTDSIEKDLLNYRLYAQTKVRLEELEKNCFKRVCMKACFLETEQKTLPMIAYNRRLGKMITELLQAKL